MANGEMLLAQVIYSMVVCKTPTCSPDVMFPWSLHVCTPNHWVITHKNSDSYPVLMLFDYFKAHLTEDSHNVIVVDVSANCAYRLYIAIGLGVNKSIK